MRPPLFHALWIACTTCLWLAPSTVQASTSGLPPAVQQALAQARIPSEALSVVVQPLDSNATAGAPRLQWRADVSMNPASTMKLLTTWAALDQLGPAFNWSTPVYVDGPVRNGTLQGNLYIQGQGDPKLVLEQLWLLLRKVQGLGIRQIQGDVVLDHSAFALPERDPGSFDGEPLRPYNVAPSALLVNFHSLAITFRPPVGGTGSAVASVQYDPPLAGVDMPASVPLNTSARDCGDYRSSLQADWSDPLRIRWRGSYPAVCGERTWPVAYASPNDYAPRALAGLWSSMGGSVTGQVRWGSVPAALLAQPPALVHASPPLSEIVRDINKFSNNVMAQQVFLSLALQRKNSNASNAAIAPSPVTWDNARQNLLDWWHQRVDPQGQTQDPLVDNGSGLSRNERISAAAMALLLHKAYRSPTMPELMASLPVQGQDGTMRRTSASSVGSAHLKTGSLNNVLARAGYVLGASGERYVVVVLVNHPQAGQARPAVEALIEWVMRER
ncbi:D-alanyl-D-alanine carboxypeptidase/D-alanyl-D-alanine-endopeptidase [Curvibacter sp. CHRR-16]|uniref:D-alanyl-D-alanine carboxypeptidase/D-alanyl-D-alanine endopeptidase n=1 Tax=Curvibacter sp. CHRR-16 TaxID=2835872 RepID=UPI002023A536|nr:D-alanyl-D-alanine carboxypeptidase/D-alanyl-D-alanine-endopeptidase [Curvibacter sp. CHRR-16]